MKGGDFEKSDSSKNEHFLQIAKREGLEAFGRNSCENSRLSNEITFLHYII